MSHLTADQIHDQGRIAMRSAHTALAESRLVSAACWYDAAADAYARLAELTSVPYRADAWRALSTAITARAAQAWAHAQLALAHLN